MSASNKASTSKPVKQTSRFRPYLFPICFVGFGVMVAVIAAYLQASVVTGSEFDTGTWTIRTFWYRRDPFSGRQLTGILREMPTSLTNSTTFPTSYFTGANSTPARWDLVKLECGTALTEGPANVIQSYFELSRFDEPIWPTWSTDNSAKAAVLWPAVRDLVDLGLYHELPRVMELATVDSTDAEFKTMVEEQMQSALGDCIGKLKIEEKADELSVAEGLVSKYSSSN